MKINKQIVLLITLVFISLGAYLLIPNFEIEEFNNKVLDILNGMYWFDRKLFTLYVKQFNSIRKLAKETRLGHVTVYNTIKRAKKNIKKKLYEK